MKKIWIGIGIAVILALLSSCGGGGGGGPSITPTSPPTSDEVSKLLPMEQNQTLKYSWTVSSSINANATGNFEIGQKRFQLGPIPLLIPLPKFLPQRDGTHTYSLSANATINGTLTTTITTNPGVTFPANWPQNIITVETDTGQGSGSATATLSIDGKPQTETHSVDVDPLLTREFLTNDSGKVKCWGMQTKNSDWGSIEDFTADFGGSPLLLLQADTSSWDVVPHIDTEDFSADIKATLLGKQTVGSYDCYVVKYTLANFQLKTQPENGNVTINNFAPTITVWYAPGTGIVKSEGIISLTGSFQDYESNAKGSITKMEIKFSTSLK